MPNGEDVNRPGDSGEFAGEAIRERLHGAAEPADPSGAYERVVEKKVARRIRRRVGTVALSVAVVAGTATGSYALIQAFHGRAPQQPAGSSTGFTNGLIAFVADGTIQTVRPDGSDLRTLTPRSLIARYPAWSPNGASIAFSASEHGLMRLYVMQSDGTSLRAVARGDFIEPAWSADGRSLLVVSKGSPHALFDVSLVGGPVTFTHLGCRPSHPAVSVTGLVAVQVSCGTSSRVDVLSADMTRRSPVPGTDGATAGPDWSQDSASLLFAKAGEIVTVSVDGTGLRTLHTGSPVVYPSYSPNGSQILYEGNVNGNTFPERLGFFIMNADGSGIQRLVQPRFGVEPSWQPVPPGGVPAPTPTPSPSPSPSPSTSPSPSPSPTELCPTSTVTADFDGDGAADVATVEAPSCVIGGTISWRISVGWGGNHRPAGQWDLPQCTDQYCSAVGSIPMNDGSNALVLRTHEGASTVFYELLNLLPSEAGPKEFTVLDPGSPEFPPGQIASFPDEGSVTQEDFFRCQGGPYPGGGDMATIVETNATLDKLQGMYTLTETVLAHGPNTGQPELIVVSRNTRQIGFDAFDPAKDVTGVPCWGGATPSP